MPLDKAALISCGVITGVGAVLNRAKVAPASTVAVLGVGGVGMSVIQGARIAGARQIIAVDVVDYKLVRAREFGATDVVNATKVDPVETVRRMSGGGVDYTFEAIGFGETARQAFEMLRDGGWATMLGVAPANATVEVPAAALRREKVLTGSSMGSNRFKVDIPRYIELYYQGKLMLDEMITKRFRLDQVDEAFQAMREGEVIRSVLMFDDDRRNGVWRCSGRTSRGYAAGRSVLEKSSPTKRSGRPATPQPRRLGSHRSSGSPGVPALPESRVPCDVVGSRTRRSSVTLPSAGPFSR